MGCGIETVACGIETLAWGIETVAFDIETVAFGIETNHCGIGTKHSDLLPPSPVVQPLMPAIRPSFGAFFRLSNLSPGGASQVCLSRFRPRRRRFRRGRVWRPVAATKLDDDTRWGIRARALT